MDLTLHIEKSTTTIQSNLKMGDLQTLLFIFGKSNVF